MLLRTFLLKEMQELREVLVHSEPAVYEPE
jgi:hypothetical protein